MIIVAVLFIISLIAFFYLVNTVFRLQNNNFDYYVFDRVAPHITDGLTRVMLFFTFLGSRAFLFPVIIMLTVYYLFLHKETEYSIMVPVVSLGTVLVNILLKSYFSRPRPLDPLLQNIQGFSFPSGHSMSAFTFYGLLIYIAWNKINNTSLKWTTIAALAFVILMIGFSRIYFRAHYATDVLAGFTIGAIWLILSIAVMRKIISFSPNQNPFTD